MPYEHLDIISFSHEYNIPTTINCYCHYVLNLLFGKRIVSFFLEKQPIDVVSMRKHLLKQKPKLSLNYLANISLFKVNNRNTKKRYEICLKLKTKTPKRLLTLNIFPTFF